MVKVLRGRDAFTVPCDSCGFQYPREEFSSLEVAKIEGFDVVRCVNPVRCRETAQKKGIWCTYES